MDRKRDTDGQEKREGHRLTERGTGIQTDRERDRDKGGQGQEQRQT
jgi:hypothetical protein